MQFSPIYLIFCSFGGFASLQDDVVLIIERADRLVNLCEIKYTHAEYTISADDDKDMRSHVASFASRTKNKCGILPTWITPYSLADNAYSADIQYEVTMDDLFL